MPRIGAGNVRCVSTNGSQKQRAYATVVLTGWITDERIVIDVAGPISTTNGGNRYILVVIDYLSV